MSVICFCFLYILYNCLFTVNVFAPQFNVSCNCEPPFITNEGSCRLFHAIFMMLPISMNYLFQLLMYIYFFVMGFALPHRSSSLFYFANFNLYIGTVYSIYRWFLFGGNIGEEEESFKITMKPKLLNTRLSTA